MTRVGVGGVGDYITGYGDCVDMVVMGAGWDKDRARELKGVFHLLVAYLN